MCILNIGLTLGPLTAGYILHETHEEYCKKLIKLIFIIFLEYSVYLSVFFILTFILLGFCIWLEIYDKKLSKILFM